VARICALPWECLAIQRHTQTQVPFAAIQRLLISNVKLLKSRPPQCPSSSFECTAVVGGGCYSNGTACSENGCIEFDGSGAPPPITSTYIATIVQPAASKAAEPSSGGPKAETDTNLIVAMITTAETIVLGGACLSLLQ
jgi:hypothetical protein